MTNTKEDTPVISALDIVSDTVTVRIDKANARLSEICKLGLSDSDDIRGEKYTLLGELSALMGVQAMLTTLYKKYTSEVTHTIRTKEELRG